MIFRDKRLLVIRRSQTVTAPGTLCLPGGGIEEGETEREALLREMQEELNLDVTPIRLLEKHNKLGHPSCMVVCIDQRRTKS